MRKNLPVTDVETQLPDNEFIYSRTDLKGIITEANDAFCAVSGFTRDEMLGQPHNMVRHPDMPEAAFADMWRDLKLGRPWRGIVKNRRKDGGFYWVVANASPVRENGQVVGYQSVRSRPTPQEISAATAAYRRLNAGDASILVRHGRVVKNRPSWVTGLQTLRAQMRAMALLALSLAAIDIGEIAFKTDFPVLHETVIGLTVLLALYSMFVYLPGLMREIRAVFEWQENLLCSGDLKQRIASNRAGMVGEVINQMDTFVSSVHAMVQGMADTARHVDVATREVGSGVHVAYESAKRQSEATSSAAAAVEQVTVSIGEVAEHARSTKDVAGSAGEVSHEGAQRSGEACATITTLAETVKQSALKVESLGQRSAEISQIAGVIKEIADQTNLLALNAAIEAARAGEQGRGFAVVADEVRKLAERTAKATQEISGMIELIQSETHQAVEGMRAGASQVEEGVDLVHSAQEALERIKQEMDGTIQRVNEISHASSEQQTAMTQLAQNVEQVAMMTEQNVALVNQTEGMALKLSAMVDRMNKSVNQFTI